MSVSSYSRSRIERVGKKPALSIERSIIVVVSRREENDNIGVVVFGNFEEFQRSVTRPNSKSIFDCIVRRRLTDFGSKIVDPA